MISVILPTYNERGNVGELVERTARALKRDFEIVVVDDDSSDGTAGEVRKLQEGRPYLRLVVRKGERGLAGAVKRGIDEAKGEVVAWMDSDLSMPPEKLPEMVRKLTKSDVVIGSYFIKGGGDRRGVRHGQFFSWLINVLARVVLGGNVTDYTSGFIVARKEAIEGADFKGAHGSYFIDVVYGAIKRGYKVGEVAYELVGRGYGESKLRGFWSYAKVGWRYLETLVRVRWGGEAKPCGRKGKLV